MTPLLSLLRDPWAFAPRDPVTLATASLVVTGIGTAVGAAGAIRQSKQAQATARANERIARQDQEQRTQAGRVAAEDERRRVQKVLSAQRAAFGAQGRPITGQVLDIMAETSAEGELLALRQQYRGQLGARASEIQALQAEREAEAAGSAGIAQAGSILLTGTSSLARQYRDLGLLDVE